MAPFSNTQWVLVLSASFVLSNVITHYMTKYFLNKSLTHSNLDEAERLTYEKQIENLKDRITALAEQIRTKNIKESTDVPLQNDALQKSQDAIIAMKTTIAKLEEENKSLRKDIEYLRMSQSVEIISSTLES